jgi:hypothetical protein
VIQIEVFDQTRRRWTAIPNGPFPISEAALHEARRRYQAEWAVCPELTGVKVSPQTTARALLREVAPHLSDFDAGMLGFAVSNDRMRIVTEGV